MRICAVVKYPPIQGGVSALSYRIVMALGAAGHQVSVVTNADEVEADYRIWLTSADRARLEATFPSGGSVTLVSTLPLGRKTYAHIPHTKPFVTKLSSLATEEIRRIDAEVVFSHYLEPYGMAAHLAAQWTGLPHVVQHAGSDRTRLLSHPELSQAYREVLRRAEVVLTQPGTVEGFGVDPERVIPLRSRGKLGVFADPATPPLDVDATIALLAGAAHPWITNTAPMPRDRATFGVYGKLGEVKGSYDLVAALGRLKDSGRRFNLLVMAGGQERERFLGRVADAGLTGHTWTLPFLPHWRVPEFLRTVSAACFLERRFPVLIHTPAIAQEILTTGTCLVVSREIADKQYFRADLRHGENAYVVEDPSDIDELAGVLGRIADDPAGARLVGQAGAALVHTGDPESELAATYERAFATAIAHHADADRPRPPAPVSNAEGGSRLLLRRYMPATLTTLGDHLEKATGQRPTPPGLTAAQHAYAGADAIVDWIGGQHVGLPEVSRAAAAFERDLLWSHLDLESADGGTIFPRRGTTGLVLSEPVRIGTRKPVRANGIRIRHYRRDIEAVLAALRAGDDYDALDPGPATFLFLKRGDLYGTVMRINPSTQDAIRLCDGNTTVADIADQLHRDHHVDAGAVEALLFDLAGKRVVWL